MLSFDTKQCESPNCSFGITCFTVYTYLVSILFLLMSFGAWIEISELVYSSRGVVFGAGFTDMSVILPIKKIFLGDAGSMFLGFFVSWLLILYSQNPINSLPPILTIWCVTIPVFDFSRILIASFKVELSTFRKQLLSIPLT